MEKFATLVLGAYSEIIDCSTRLLQAGKSDIIDETLVLLPLVLKSQNHITD